MSKFKLISWTPHKKRYDLIMVSILMSYLLSFCISQYLLYKSTLPAFYLIKSFGTLAFFLFVFILCIGPLARLFPTFLPILYNRRHLGVTMFLVGMVHGLISLILYHGLGNENPLISLFTTNPDYTSIPDFPYMTAGFGALFILGIMALTSHDFWLDKLGPKIWKYLHMMVYVVFVLVGLHLLSGVLQSERSTGLNILIGLLFSLVIIIHLLAAWKNYKARLTHRRMLKNGFLEVGKVEEFTENRAKIISSGNKSIAIFYHQGKFFGYENYCRHQGGPLGEGKIVDGCVTCPWHGFQYQLKDGTSPPPYDETILTYNTKVVENTVFVSAEANQLGTDQISGECELHPKTVDDDFYIGWAKKYPDKFGKPTFKLSILLLLCSVTLGITVPHLLEPLKDSIYSFNKPAEYTGILSIDPVPKLTMEMNGTLLDYLLVNKGKFSAKVAFEKFARDYYDQLNNKKVTVDALEISYDQHHLLELHLEEKSILKVEEGNLENDSFTFNAASNFRGEIVDPKCFFGAMNPGQGKLHRDCAIRCLAGGIPAVFVSADQDYFILLNEKGQLTNEQILHLVGEKVSLQGSTTELNGWKYLYVDSKKGIQRLSFQQILGGKDLLCRNSMIKQF